MGANNSSACGGCGAKGEGQEVTGCECRDSGLGRAGFRSSEGRSCLNYGLDTSTLDMRTVSHNRGMATVDVGKALISQGPPLEIEETGHQFQKVALASRSEALVAQL